MIYQDFGDPVESENWLRRAIDYSRTALDHRGEAIAKVSLAELQHSQGRYDEALASGEAALFTLDELTDPQAIAVREFLERIRSTGRQRD
jgi:tetratricopeptide (TPR) repeat protein